jgi:hypothetical protein
MVLLSPGALTIPSRTSFGRGLAFRVKNGSAEINGCPGGGKEGIDLKSDLLNRKSA